MSEVACSCSDRQSPSFCEAMGMKREWSSAAPSRSMFFVFFFHVLSIKLSIAQCLQKTIYLILR